MIKNIKNQIANLFSKESETNPFYKKLVNVPTFKEKAKAFDRIYFLGGFEYNNDSFVKFKDALGTGSIAHFLTEVKYNVQKDNIELYFFENQAGKNYLMALLDPYELLSGERILDFMESPEIAVKDFDFELIYSRSNEN